MAFSAVAGPAPDGCEGAEPGTGYAVRFTDDLPCSGEEVVIRYDLAP